MRAVAQITITNICDVVTSDTPPEDPYYGQLWVNTATVPPETMVWDGQGWIVQNNLEDLRQTVSTHTTRFGEFQSSVDGLNSYVSSMTETVEKLEGSVSGEQEKVLEMQAQVSELQHSVEGLSVTVQEQFAGGINHIKNSAGLNGITDDWVTTGTVATDSSTDVQNNTTSDSCFILGDTSTLKQVVTGVVTGSSYQKHLDEEVKAEYRKRRETECFSVINRGQLWYEGISIQQLLELRQWYKAWLEVTETMVVPEKPTWLT